jgi:hypothetical protein
MALKSTARVVSVSAVILCGLFVAAPAGAQLAPAATLGTVSLPQAVKANGQDLAAGSYTLRLSDDAVPKVVGQAPDSAQWVEFVRGGKVAGKELATKVSAADVKSIAEMTPPAAGSSKVQMLKGADYVRVWINRAGTHYLVHLAAVPK